MVIKTPPPELKSRGILSSLTFFALFVSRLHIFSFKTFMLTDAFLLKREKIPKGGYYFGHPVNISSPPLNQLVRAWGEVMLAAKLAKVEKQIPTIGSLKPLLSQSNNFRVLIL